jgi:hypothetical protein
MPIDRIPSAGIESGGVAPSNLSTGAPSWTTSGAVILQGGDTGANGIGITFPATQSASSNANTLDDYEEGTWTPTLTFNGLSTGITYGARPASYVKIGQFVYCSFNIVLTSKGSATGSSGITGLPFVGGGTVTFPMAASNIFNLTSTTQTMLQIGTGGTTMEIKFSGLDSNPTEANFTNSTQIRAAFVYQSNA